MFNRHFIYLLLLVSITLVSLLLVTSGFAAENSQAVGACQGCSQGAVEDSFKSAATEYSVVKEVEIAFSKPTSLRLLSELFNINGIKLTGIIITYPVGSQQFTQYLNTQELEDVKDLIGNIHKTQTECISKVQSSCERKIAEGLLSAEGQKLMRELEKALTQKKKELSVLPDDYKVNRVTVLGPEDLIDAVTKVLPVSHVVPSTAPSNNVAKEKLPESTSGPSTSPLALPSPETWVPEEGVCETYQSGSNREVFQWLYWDDVSGFLGWSPHPTYEHDFFTDYYDGKAYFNPNSSFSGIPIVVSWSTSLPCPYLDTRASDPAGEKAYTIGSGHAEEIRKNLWYFTQIKTTPGNASTDRGKLIAQVGWSQPAGCCSTWCSFSIKNEFIVPAWQIAIPGSKYWRY